MINLLRSDLYRLRKSMALWILMLIGALLSILVVVIFKYVLYAGTAQAAVSPDSSFPLDKITGFDMSYQMFASGQVLPMFIAIFASIFVTGEFAGGTIKNILSKGYGRTGFYFSKLITVAVATAAILLATSLSGLVAGGIAFGLGADTGITSIIRFAWTFLIQSFLHSAYAAIFLMLSMLIRNVGGAVVASICFAIFPDAIIQLIALLTKSDNVGAYWFSSYIKVMSATSPAADAIIKALVVGLCYIVVTTIIGISIFRKQDVT